MGGAHGMRVLIRFVDNIMDSGWLLTYFRASLPEVGKFLCHGLFMVMLSVPLAHSHVYLLQLLLQVQVGGAICRRARQCLGVHMLRACRWSSGTPCPHSHVRHEHPA